MAYYLLPSIFIFYNIIFIFDRMGAWLIYFLQHLYFPCKTNLGEAPLCSFCLFFYMGGWAYYGYKGEYRFSSLMK
jgi:hypothetical protein